MKRVACVFLTLVLVLSFVACDYTPTAGHGTSKNDFPLFTIAMVGTVGGEGIGYVKRLEEDSYGRIFFEFAIANLMNPYFNGLRGYGVCQKIEDEYAYYFEDVWYTGATQVDKITEEEKTMLKEVNDWNKEIDGSKTLTKVRSFSKRYETNIFDISDKEMKNALELFAELKNISDDDIESYEIQYSSRDSEGKTLFYIATGEDRYGKEAYKTSKMFAIIVDENGDVSERSVLEINDPYNCATEMSAFKAENAWTPNT